MPAQHTNQPDDIPPAPVPYTSRWDRKGHPLWLFRMVSRRVIRWPIIERALVIFGAGMALFTLAQQQNTLESQVDALRFEQSQRTIETTVDLTKLWNEGFNAAARTRLVHLRDAFKDDCELPKVLKIPEAAKESHAEEFLKTNCLLVQAFINDKTLSSSTEIIQHEQLFKFLQPEDPKQKRIEGQELVKEAMEYRTTLINVLNTMDAISQIRTYAATNDARSIEAQRLIDDMFQNIIKTRTRQFLGFIKVYRYKNIPIAGDPLAWNNLRDLLECTERPWALPEAMACEKSNSGR